MTIPPITSPFLPAAPQRPEAPRPMFSALAIASSGLSAQRVRMIRKLEDAGEIVVGGGSDDLVA